jgi:hypothetical protein
MLMQPWNPELIKHRSSLHEPLTPSMRTRPARWLCVAACRLAQIADMCRWYAVAGPPTGLRQAAALAELAHITGGRTDLLARYAGQSLARHDAALDKAVHEPAAQLCILAGADMDLIERWRREGRPRRTRNRPEASAVNRHDQ